MGRTPFSKGVEVTQRTAQLSCYTVINVTKGQNPLAGALGLLAGVLGGTGGLVCKAPPWPLAQEVAAACLPYGHGAGSQATSRSGDPVPKDFRGWEG